MPDADDKAQDVNNEDANNEQEEVKDGQAPASMDDRIEEEAEKELDKALGKDTDKEDETDEEADDGDDKGGADDEDGKGDEADDADKDAEKEEADEDEDKEEEVEDAVIPEQPAEEDFVKHGVDAFDAKNEKGESTYKPANWAQFAKDVVSAVRGEVAKERTVLQQQQDSYKKEVTAIEEQWNNEITELTKGGALPKDEGARKKEVEATYKWMGEHNKKYEGQATKQVWSFEIAHEMRQGKRVSKERESEIAARREARAGNISGGGSNEGGSRRTPAKGTSMDDIIADLEDSEQL